MPQFSQFIAIMDRGFTLPQSEYPNDFERGPFSLPDLNPNRTAILVLMVRARGAVRLQMTLNNENVFDYLFDPPEPDSTRPRSWHQVVPGRILSPENNYFVAAAQPQEHGGGTVEMSNIVLFYHASTEDPPRTLL
jgi:hypothetical protein